jgi:hypothetical protein
VTSASHPVPINPALDGTPKEHHRIARESR